MGSCHQTEKIQKNPQPRLQHQNALKEKSLQLDTCELNAPEPEKNQSIFKDMPEYPGDLYKGYGIKRMKAYKCTLNIKDLNQLRDEFWSN